MKNSMRLFPALSLGLVFFFSCEQQNAQSPQPAGPAPVPVAHSVSQSAPAALPAAEPAKVIFATEEHDFGQIPKGTPVKYRFTFTNETGEALVLQSVKPSCSCTAADYTKDPIPAGGQGFVVAEFNAAHEGVFRKSVTVTTNAGTHVLNLKGEVMP